MSQPIEIKVKNRVYGKGRGWCFTPKNFEDLGSEASVNTALHRLQAKGFIRRLLHGLYDYPRSHEKLGLLPPSIESIASALAEKYKVKIQPSGAYAANLLGLSEQVPGKIIFLTDGTTKSLRIGKLEISFRKTTPKNMKTAGKISGLIIQALRHLKKENFTEEMIEIIQKKLNSEDRKRLKLDAKYAPAWISRIIKDYLVKV
jgi:hypothetical protein